MSHEQRVNERILLVGVEPELVGQTTARLDGSPYEVVTAGDGQNGLAAARSRPPCVIVVDCSMPTRDGTTMVLELKREAAFTQTAVILLAAPEQMRDAMLLEGIDGPLLKPVRSEQFFETLRHHVTLPKRILVAEDDPDMLTLVTARLETVGYEVLSATDGQEALRKAKAVYPDLMVLDIVLPKLDGFHVCHLLKFDAGYDHIPIIMLTAKAQERDEQLGKNCGTNVYLRKPFKGEELLAQIRTLLDPSYNASEVQ